jgi:hypothetical protein
MSTYDSCKNVILSSWFFKSVALRAPQKIETAQGLKNVPTPAQKDEESISYLSKNIHPFFSQNLLWNFNRYFSKNIFLLTSRF